jgi:uroporphyrinogen III methyltransferase/synthase
VVGTATAEILRGYGIKADLLPTEFTGEGLAEVLLARGVKGNRILIPRALQAREILPEKLQEGGAEVTVAPVYQNVRPDDYAMVRQALEEKEIDMVTFTSSSTVRNFLEMLKIENEDDFQRLLGGVKIAVIGPITAKTALKNNLKIDVEPETYTIPAMVEAIVDFYSCPAGESGA